jgi:hypothetical protein
VDFVPLGEGLVERAERTPEGYAAKVRVLAAIYFALNVVCVAVIVLAAWRGKHLVTLAQRSNVETMVLAIVVVLALFYLATTFRGFVGALRMAALNGARLWSRAPRGRGAQAARSAERQRTVRGSLRQGCRPPRWHGSVTLADCR